MHVPLRHGLLRLCMVVSLLLGSITAVHAEAELSPQNAQPAAPAIPVQEPPPQTAPPSPAPPPSPDPLSQLPGVNVEAVNAVPPITEEKITVKEGPNGKITYVERPEDSQLILELLLDDKATIIDPALPVYMVNETVLVPLGKFVKLLDLPITVDTAKGTAEGWFINPENTFQLSSPYNSIEIAGKKSPLPKTGIIETHLDDIYVSLDLLTSWFPIGLTLNYHELRLYMKTLTDLPFQERAKRRGRWEASKEAQERQPGQQYDPASVIQLPYHMYTAPALQVSHGYTHSMSPEGSTSTTATNLNATADLLDMNARAGVSFSTSTKNPPEIQGVSFNMSKEDYNGNLLGPLKATRYELGDVSADAMPLTGAASGRGFTLTNQPYNFVSDANNFHISGFGPAGWDVEVFQGTELLAFGPVAADGSYIFDTLPLKSGFNLFKIVLYGPNGEKEERYDRFFLGQNMVPKGKFFYNMAAIQSSTPLFDLSRNPPDETQPTASVTGEYGITKNISATTGYFRGPLGHTMLGGPGLGLRASSSRIYTQLNSFFNKLGGKTFSGLVTGNITETTTFNINDLIHRDFEPGLYSVSRSTTASVSKIFEFANSFVPDFNLTLQTGRDREETGRIKTTYVGHLSTSFMGLNLANNLERAMYNDDTADTYNGSVNIGVKTPLGRLNGDMSYLFYKPFRWKTGTLSLQSNLTNNLTLTTGLNHSFDTTSSTALSAGLDWRLENIHLGLTGSMDNAHNKQVGMTVTYNLKPRTPYGDYAISSLTDDLNTGRLIIRPFVDRNGNGVYDKDEPFVKGVEFRNTLRGTVSTANDADTVLLAGLTPNLANRITVDDATIGDIFITPVKKEMIVMGKTGVNGPIDFAFSKLGSITGKIVTHDPATGEEIPLNGVRMSLLDQNGKEAAEAYSELDGFFSFESIPVGSYTLFFPVSETLQKYYSGKGEGPQLNISFDSPELSDVKLQVEHDSILAENQLDKSEKSPEIKN